MKRTLLIALALVVSVGVPGAANADPRAPEPAPSVPADLMADYHALYPGLSDQDVARRLDRLPVRKTINERQAVITPNTFAGTDYDFAADMLHVYATTERGAAQIAAHAVAAGQPATAHAVRYSLRTLTQQQAALTSGPDRLPADAQVHVDIARNRVVVGLTTATRRAFAGRSLPDSVEVTTARTFPPTQYAACSNRYDCGAPLRSGVNVGPWNATANHATAFCSLAFTMHASDGSRWALTAGHCVSQDAINRGQTWAHGAQPIGPVRQRQDDGRTAVDAARIRIDSSYWRQTGGGYMYYTPTATVDVDYAIVARGTIANGDPVCFNARSYVPGDDNCGVVTSSIGFRGMFTVSGVKACGGDSGGAAYLLISGQRWAYGLINSTSPRGSNDCMYGGSVTASAIPDINAWFDAHAAATIRVDTR
jgi:streptogrisin C